MHYSRITLWLGSRVALWSGTLLALSVIGALVSLGWYQHASILKADLARAELMARVLDDNATRTIETVSVVLDSVSEKLTSKTASLDEARANSALADIRANFPVLRDLAVLNEDGQVLASSSDADIHAVLDQGRLGPWPAAGREKLGAFVSARGLSDLVAGNSRQVPPGVGVIPLLRTIQWRSGQQLLLLALINPGGFTNFQAMTLGDTGSAAMLLSYTGELLAASSEAMPVPGSQLNWHPVFRHYLPHQEYASYLGQGVDAGKKIVAFRVSRLLPLVVVVEQPYAETVTHWIAVMRGFGLVGACFIAFVVITVMAAQRSLRVRESVRKELDTVQIQVAQREQEMSVLVKSVQELIFRTDDKGIVTFVNERWTEMTGEPRQVALRRHFSELVESEDRAVVAALFEHDEISRVSTASAVIRAHNGAERHMEIFVAPLRGPAGITGFAGSAMNVTSRWLAQQALRQQLAFTELLLEISPQPICMFNNTGRYQMVNRAWENFIGFPRAEVVGLTSSEFMSPREAAIHDENNAALLQNAGQVRYEAQALHRDGRRRDVVIAKVPVSGENGLAVGILCTLIDVSEFREAERAIFEAKELAEEASRAKTEFISNISHELRTPLQSILGFSELGLVRGGGQPQFKGMFLDINSAGHRMLALVNDLLDLSKFDSLLELGDISDEGCIDLSQALRSVLNELSPQVLNRGVRVQLDLDPVPLPAAIPPFRFEQIMRNIVANAIKFSPIGASIFVRGERSNHGEVHFSVRDHGPGIPVNELDKIFEAFHQSSLTKDGSGGTGLGLAISRKIAKAYGGRIEAANMLGSGAVFSVYLPSCELTQGTEV
ncbi:MAG: PAS domain S-box protein [Gammaproteobacteria bacterium]|nr:PAS domain S-box protein [Gammaproteobacteria bacterium]MBU0787770.1 PAS domain S-box protein [Gammaproteobacteria bacterium]MBU0816207.1 PAS domain S-box protein [Gammaproteobacteria bacterium]MBU1786132.1 PAS domain S-box protein [Gammaproteobacteria bacterium]